MIPNVDRRNALDGLDLSRTLDEASYDGRLEAAQLRLLKLTQGKKFRRRALVAVFEGPDAAGKGGAIRRLTRGDGRPRLPGQLGGRPDRRGAGAARISGGSGGTCRRKGRVAIFDRSWYGRVLVERVEGFAGRAEWRRAYGEINDFEEQLAATASSW